jgi:hypothetical protein
MWLSLVKIWYTELKLLCAKGGKNRTNIKMLNFYFKSHFESFIFLRFLMKLCAALFNQIWSSSCGFWEKRRNLIRNAFGSILSFCVLLINEKNIYFLKNHPLNILIKFASNCHSGFREFSYDSLWNYVLHCSTKFDLALVVSERKGVNESQRGPTPNET